MVIDVHCHVGFSARRTDAALPRFSFEQHGAAARPGFDSYFSPRFIARWQPLCRLGFVRRMLGVDWRLGPCDALDAQIQAFNDRHMLAAAGVDRMVLLAFDEYHAPDGTPLGPPPPRSHRGSLGSDLYVSNTLVRSLCAARPDKFLFGASLHPYRVTDGRDAASLLEELKSAGAVLIKWLPIHQNIRAGDPRTVAFLRRAAELNVTMLIHYGGEMTLARQHMEFESPAELLSVMRDLRRERRMPTVIVAHVATPSTRFHSARSFRLLTDALLGEFRDAPLYADVSALAAMGRAVWLPRIARWRELHRKLVWGTDFPVPLFPTLFVHRMGIEALRIGHIDSWIERDLRLKRAMGLSQDVFHRAGELLLGV
ncbi:MAG: amidohydrolase family protein [Phycisphaerae bacterium]|nr:amidohydrolase [Phycisphaerae bacterium]NUQ45000.1 amidohydrolase family protein [Phycisphaerae bacterium]